MQAVINPSIDKQNISVTFQCMSSKSQFTFSCIIYPKKHLQGLRNLKLWKSLAAGENVTIDTPMFASSPILKRQTYPVITQTDDLVLFTPRIEGDCVFQVALQKADCVEAFNVVADAVAETFKGALTAEIIMRDPELLLDQLLISGSDSESIYTNAEFLRQEWQDRK